MNLKTPVVSAAFSLLTCTFRDPNMPGDRWFTLVSLSLPNSSRCDSYHALSSLDIRAAALGRAT